MLDVPPANTVHVGVGAGADPPPILIAPIGNVVGAAVLFGTAALGRAGPVGDLVPVEPGLAQQSVGQDVLLGLIIGVHLRNLAASDLGGELGAVLDDQRIRGEVIGPQIQGGFHRTPPIAQGLPRCAVNQIHTDRQSRLTGTGHRERHIGRGVGTLQHLEHVGYGGLHAEGHAVHARLGQGLERAVRHRVRVGLHRDLRVRGQPETLACLLQNSREVLGREQRGRAAAEEHAVQWARWRPGGLENGTTETDLRGGVVMVIFPGHVRAQLGHRVRVEVAVAAAHRAERDVHVQAQRAFVCPGHRARG